MLRYTTIYEGVPKHHAKGVPFFYSVIPEHWYLFLTMTGVHKEREQGLQPTHLPVPLLQHHRYGCAYPRVMSSSHFALVPVVITCYQTLDDLQQQRGIPFQLNHHLFPFESSNLRNSEDGCLFRQSLLHSRFSVPSNCWIVASLTPSTDSAALAMETASPPSKVRVSLPSAGPNCPQNGTPRDGVVTKTFNKSYVRLCPANPIINSL